VIALHCEITLDCDSLKLSLYVCLVQGVWAKQDVYETTMTRNFSLGRANMHAMLKSFWTIATGITTRHLSIIIIFLMIH